VRTLCTLIKDPAADTVLAPYAELLSQARHWAFKEIHLLHRSVAEVKKEVIVNFGLTARQFNGLNVQLEQTVECWREGLKYQIANVAERIKALPKTIAILEKKIAKEQKLGPEASHRKIDRWWFSIHQKKRHLAACESRVDKLLVELAGPPRICFGGRKLLKSGQIEEWREKRRSQIFLVGSSDETAGNQSAQWDGENLLIKQPESQGGKRVLLKGVKFSYGTECLKNRAGQALSWLLFKDAKGRWHANVSLKEVARPVSHDLCWGAIGVDVNENHLAVAIIDRHGNLIGTETLDFPESGLATGVAEDILWAGVHRLVQLAKENHCGLVVEDLEFSRKKAYLKKFGKKHAQRLSAFAYARFFEMLSAASAREGVLLRKINPAYTSQTGRLKYMVGYHLTVHHAAALVIGRQGMNFGERLVCKDNGTLVAAASTPKAAHGRVVTRHVLSRWRGVSWLTRGESGRLVSMLAAIAFWKEGIIPKKRLSRARKLPGLFLPESVESHDEFGRKPLLNPTQDFGPHPENASL
jgi:IS605 OrfB family transposase